MAGDPIRPEFTERPEAIEVDNLGCHDIELPCGVVHFHDATGVMTSVIKRGGVPSSVAVSVHDGNGKGITLQLDPMSARSFAAGILRHANEIDPKGVS